MIQYYEVDGRSKDVETIASHRDEWEAWFTSMLRDRGYIPVLHLTSEWTVLYVEEDESFRWSVRIPVMEIGKDLAWQFRGVYGERLCPEPTP